MKVHSEIMSPNFSAKVIPVEFVVLHYTACPLEKTLEIFGDPQSKFCSHFVLDVDGSVYDLGGFMKGDIRQGAHAGESCYTAGGVDFKVFNEFSIGVEIVNLNGNLFDYTEAQYASLQELVLHLITRFPKLKSPDRIVGHEQIAGHRGKSDPGRRFDWSRFYQSVYGQKTWPKRTPICADSLIAEWEARIQSAPAADKKKPEFWMNLSTELEMKIKEQKSH